jgi:uncharacterized protein
MNPIILTNSGKFFSFVSPEDSDYCIEDIAHALSHINRWTGHTRVPYNVADHSVRVSHVVPKKHALAALLHDASEAFCGDVASPLKAMLSEYKEIEQRVEKAIFAKFGVEYPYHTDVKRADQILLLTERRDLLPVTEEQLTIGDLKPLKERIWPLKNREAREAFLQRFMELTK